MKVSELITELSKWNPDSEIRVIPPDWVFDMILYNTPEEDKFVVSEIMEHDGLEYKNLLDVYLSEVDGSHALGLTEPYYD